MGAMAEETTTAAEPAGARRTHQDARPGGRSARVRAAVLQAAARELLEGGYAGFSMPRVAERAGVALSTVHRRWPQKDRLIADAIGELTAAAVPDPQCATLREDLIALAESVALMLRDPATQQVLRSVFVLPDAELAALRAAHWAPRFALAQEVVARAIDRGELPPESEGWTVVEPVYAPIWMRLLITGLPVDRATIERTVDDAIAAAQRARR